jgi:hypothetical protein
VLTMFDLPSCSVLFGAFAIVLSGGKHVTREC